MTRWKASSIHLALSALVLSVVAVVLVWRWYPPGLFHMARAGTLLNLIGGVDLVLGPLLTLIVFKQGKKSLKFDLAVIALLQLAALLFGLHTAWQSRPVFLVASDTRMTLVYANEIEAADLADAPVAYRELPALGPRTVAVTMPDEIAATVTRMTGEDPRRMPARYKPYAAIAGRLRDNALPVPELAAALAPEDRELLDAAVRATGREAATLGAVPVGSLRGNAAMLLDLGSGEPVRPVAIALPAGAGARTATPASQKPLQNAGPGRQQ